jgi:predicted RNase H-like HicB family nuclease
METKLSATFSILKDENNKEHVTAWLNEIPGVIVQADSIQEARKELFINLFVIADYIKNEVHNKHDDEMRVIIEEYNFKSA